jgi:hypothetical protein
MFPEGLGQMRMAVVPTEAMTRPTTWAGQAGQPAETNDFILLTVKTKKINFKFD